MDGSAVDFVDAIRSVGVEEQNEPRKFIKSVPIGKFGKYNLEKFDVKKRRTDPIAPPLAT